MLSAVAASERTSVRIGGRLGRPAGALAHPLTVLCDVGYLARDDDLFPSESVRVGRATVADPSTKQSHEVDVVVLGEDRQVLLLGEATWSAPLGTAARSRLERIRSLLESRGHDVSACRFLLASGTGSVDATALDPRDLVLDLAQLYTG